MDKIRLKLQQWIKVELKRTIKELISCEIQKFNTEQVAVDEPSNINKLSYSQTLKNDCEAVLVVRPRTKKSEENFSEDSKKEYKK